jgi:hypothetical protein
VPTNPTPITATRGAASVGIMLSLSGGGFAMCFCLTSAGINLQRSSLPTRLATTVHAHIGNASANSHKRKYSNIHKGIHSSSKSYISMTQG